MKFFCLVGVLMGSMFLVNGQAEDFNYLCWNKADSVAMLYPNYPLTNLNELAFKLTAPFKTDEEKFRAIYRWTCENISYDHSLFLKNQKIRSRTNDPELLAQWNKKGNALMFEGLIKKHKTICTGYAYLIQELASLAGIKCIIVDGYGRGSTVNVGGNGFPNHQWNAVQLNNKWYLCDATWSAGYILVPSGLYIKDFREAYFLSDPKQFVRNHYPLDSNWILLDQKPSLEQFLNGPLIYYPFFEMRTTHVIPETFEINTTKNENVEFKFNSAKDSIGQISIQISNLPIKKASNLKADTQGFYTIDQKFSHKGLFIVHISQNHQNILSYKVRVR